MARPHPRETGDSVNLAGEARDLNGREGDSPKGHVANFQADLELNSGYLEPFTLQQTNSSIGVWPFFPIRVGSNPKPFNMSLDTCSSITWLYSSLIPERNRRGHNTYDPEANVPFCDHRSGVRYGDGMDVSTDGIYLDRLGLGKTTQRDQMIFRASSVVAPKGIGQSILLDGILALKPRHDANSTSPTVWAKLAADLPEPIFIADLRFNCKGLYTFGKIPPRYTDVKFWDGEIEEKDFWTLPITSYMIDGFTAEKTDFKAKVDTACSNLCLPSCIVRSYYANVLGSFEQSGRYFFPSGQALPDLVLYIGEERHAVRISGKFLQPQGTLSGEPFTMGRLQESPHSYGPILGHPLFFAQIVVFKGVNALSVGLVEKSVEDS